VPGSAAHLRNTRPSSGAGLANTVVFIDKGPHGPRNANYARAACDEE
jgi:hypothetical protein